MSLSCQYEKSVYVIEISLLNYLLHTLCLIPLGVIDFKGRERERERRKKSSMKNEVDRGCICLIKTIERRKTENR